MEIEKIDDVYSVSEDGRVFHAEYGELELELINGEPIAELVYGDDVIGFKVSRLVAELFMYNHLNQFATIKHKDGDLTNNHWSNLQWVKGTKPDYPILKSPEGNLFTVCDPNGFAERMFLDEGGVYNLCNGTAVYFNGWTKQEANADGLH